METYFFKSGLALVCFYMIYWLSVRHNSWFTLNRFVILISVLIASLFPFISIDLITNNQVSQTLEPFIVTGMNKVPFIQPTENSISIFSIVYIIGLIVFAIRSITGLATLFFMYRRSPKVDYHGFKVVLISGNQSPFTFFNLLFISKTDFDCAKMDELIIHEKVHQNQWHSIDLVMMEILTAIHWFNPAIWLFKRDLKSEHEFFADEQVIRKGIDLNRYQKLLLQSNEGLSMYLANYFNYSILKKRLKMMNIKKSKKLASIKYLFAAPLMVFTLTMLLFSFQINRQTVMTPDVMPEYVDGNEIMYKTIQRYIKYPQEARKKNIQGLVFVSFTVTKKGKVIDIKAADNQFNLLKEIVVIGYSDNGTSTTKNADLSVIQEECERVIGLLGDFNPGKKDGKLTDVRMTLPMTFKIS